MYYELLVLGRLMYGPHHGYLIAAVLNAMVGPWQKISAGTLYPLLARLETAGLISSAGTRERASRRVPRAYTITDRGRQRFRALMLDTTSAVGDYQRLFELKVAHFEFLTPAERGGLIEHYQDYCRAVVRHREKNLRDLAGWLDDLEHGRDTRPRTPDGTIAGPGATRAGMRQAMRVAQHMAEQWRAELAWAGSLVGDASGTRAERAQHAEVPSA